MLAGTSATASGQLVRGRITDYPTGAILADVQIDLIDDGGRVAARATTDDEGFFAIRPRLSGTYRLRAGLIGYQTFTTEPLALASEDLVELALQLSIEPVDLTPVIVRTTPDRGRLAEYDRRRTERVSGYFITREEIERRPIATASELLIVVPGVTLAPLSLHGIRQDRYTIMVRGTMGPCMATVFINGMLVSQSGMRTVDDLLISDWIEGIEVYPTAVAAPLEYRRGCGVVLFWTRNPEPGTNWRWIKVAAAAVFVAGAALLTR
jgi:hypothetical protein